MAQQGSRDQIELFQLIFTVSWEDPRSDYAALRIAPNDVLCTITSGACNTLSFLAHDPGKVFAVDINPTQSYVLELKIAAMRHLDRDECLAFFGVTTSSGRPETYAQIRKDLSPDARSYWDTQADMLAKGFLMGGRYEHFVRIVGRLIRIIQGGARVDGLLAQTQLESQRSFYDTEWDTWRTKLIFNAFFNKRILARRGLKADYFHFDDGSSSFAESFRNRFTRAARNIPVEDNYFLHAYLQGSYRSTDIVPDYLSKDLYETVRSRLDRITIVTADAKEWLSEQPDDCIDCFSLSNICELMSLDDTARTFREVARTARNRARMCFRNLMIPRTVPEDLQDTIVRDTALSAKLLAEDRSFVYSRVDALYTP